MSAPGRGGGGRLKSARGRTASQQRWLRRQLADPYVAEAKRKGLRSRAAFKLIEIDDKLRLLKPGGRVVDLGAAPGGWSQVAAERVGVADGAGRVVAVDVLPFDPIPGVVALSLDFMAAEAQARIGEALGSSAGVVLSDMAGAATGQRDVDHLRIVALVEAAAAFARQALAPGGAFVAKLLQGGDDSALFDALKRDFATVRRLKPAASRSDSAEFYVAATGFRGGAGNRR